MRARAAIHPQAVGKMCLSALSYSPDAGQMIGVERLIDAHNDQHHKHTPMPRLRQLA